MKKLIATGIILLFFCGILQHTKPDTYNECYVIGSVPDLTAFETYNIQEKKLDSFLLRRADAPEGAFKKNRARLFIQNYSNQKPVHKKEELSTGMPALCRCNIVGDTLKIQAGIGLFGGLKTEIEIVKNFFKSGIYLYSDDTPMYKAQSIDTAYTSSIRFKNKYQALILTEKPTFKAGQQLTGYVSLTSPDWYENPYATFQEDTNSVQINMHFTCKVK